MSKRYYAKSTQEVLESYERLFRDKLQAMDSLARSMYTDLIQEARIPSKDVPGIMSQFFAEVWELVAETEDQREGRRRKDELEKGNKAAASVHSFLR